MLTNNMAIVQLYDIMTELCVQFQDLNGMQ